MPRYDEQEGIAFSIIDRLIDPTVPDSADKALRRLKESVLLDLERLLNTRRRVPELPEELEEAAGTIVTYGLPDLSSFAVGEEPDRELLRGAIEEVIMLFEPRLRDVIVDASPSGGNEGALHFRIDASLLVSPSPEPISFDTRLELNSGEYKIQEG